MNDMDALRERAKELRCIYRVNEAVLDRSAPPGAVFLSVLSLIPDGWQRPETTGARIEYLGRSYVGHGYTSLGDKISAPIRLWQTDVGFIEVSDTFDGGPGGDTFLKEEVELLDTIAKRLGEYLEWKHTQLLGQRLPAAPEHWRWRQNYIEALAASLDRPRFGVGRLFLGGSTESGEAGPGSDIDLYLEFSGTDQQRRELSLWIDGWSRCLGELAFQQTGYQISGGLIDVHFLDPVAALRMASELREIHLSKERSQPPRF